MHKSSGKHMPDSSDEFHIDDSDLTSDSDTERIKRKKQAESEEQSEERRKALHDLIKKTAVVPLEKLPDDITKAKTEELQAHLGKFFHHFYTTIEVLLILYKNKWQSTTGSFVVK